MNENLYSLMSLSVKIHHVFQITYRAREGLTSLHLTYLLVTVCVCMICQTERWLFSCTRITGQRTYLLHLVQKVMEGGGQGGAQDPTPQSILPVLKKWIN